MKQVPYTVKVRKADASSVVFVLLYSKCSPGKLVTEDEALLTLRKVRECAPDLQAALNTAYNRGRQDGLKEAANQD